MTDATDGLLIAAKHARDRADRIEALARAEAARARAIARMLETTATELEQVNP